MNEGGGEALIENLKLQQYGTETENPTAVCIVGVWDSMICLNLQTNKPENVKRTQQQCACVCDTT